MSSAFEWLGDYDERDAYHPEAYAVVAFNDVVGIVCSSDCGNKAVAEWKGCPSEALEHLGVKY